MIIISDHVSLTMLPRIQCATFTDITVRASKRGTPTSSNHPSPPTFDTLADMLNDALIPATPSCEMARKKVSHLYSLFFYDHTYSTNRLSLVMDIDVSYRGIAMKRRMMAYQRCRRKSIASPTLRRQRPPSARIFFRSPLIWISNRHQRKETTMQRVCGRSWIVLGINHFRMN